jgi:hypothetical protein
MKGEEEEEDFFSPEIHSFVQKDIAPHDNMSTKSSDENSSDQVFPSKMFSCTFPDPATRDQPEFYFETDHVSEYSFEVYLHRPTHISEFVLYGMNLSYDKNRTDPSS